MGVTKTAFFTAEQNSIAVITKALGHPPRVAITDYLVKEDVCIYGDIVNALPLVQPTVSQHLKKLKNAGLIKGEIEGNAIFYCINIEAIAELQNYFTKMSIKLEYKKNNCC